MTASFFDSTTCLKNITTLEMTLSISQLFYYLLSLFYAPSVLFQNVVRVVRFIAAFSLTITSHFVSSPVEIYSKLGAHVTLHCFRELIISINKLITFRLLDRLVPSQTKSLKPRIEID